MLILTFIAFFMFSVAYNMIGPLATNIMETTGLTLPQIGSLVSAQQVGALLSMGFLLMVQKKSRTSIIARTGYLAIILSFTLIAVMRMNGFLFAAYGILGFGSFLVDSGSNSYIASEYFNKRGSYISFLHFVYGIGAIVTGFLILPFKSDLWPYAFALVALIIAGVTIAHWRVDAHHLRSRRSISEKQQGPVKPLMKDVPFILYTFVILLYMGNQITCSAWIPVYVETELAQSGTVTAASLMTFWIGISASRLLIGSIMEKGIEPYTLSIWGMALSGVSLLITASGIQNIPVVLLFTALTGFFAGSTIPMYIVITSTWFPRNTTFISLAYILSGTIGRMIIPVGVTIIAAGTSLAVSLRLSSSVLFLSAIITLIVQRMTKERTAAV